MKQILLIAFIILLCFFVISCSSNTFSINPKQSENTSTKKTVDINSSASPKLENDSPANTSLTTPTNSSDSSTSDCFTSSVQYTQSILDVTSFKEYKAVETKCFTFFVPKDWVIKISDNGPIVITKDEMPIGEMDVYFYFDADTWISKGFKPNHTEQLEFTEILPPKIEGLTIHAYQSKLKEDPTKNTKEDYKYKTAALVAIKEMDRSFFLYVDSKIMTDAIVQKIVSSVRLK
jgi:hypothetical protein